MTTGTPRGVIGPRAIPSMLYKYVGSADHHLRILSDCRIRFTQPDDFNDPFDGMPGIVPPDIAEFVDETFTRNAMEIARRGLTKEQVELARETMIRQYTRDPESVVERCFTIVRRNINEVGILSLAEHRDNMPMWAHYAESYKGFVLGIRSDLAPLTKRHDDIDGEGELGPVDYATPRPIVPVSPLILPRNLLYIKGPLWAYEHEWRIVRSLAKCDSSLADASGNPRYHFCNIDPEAIVDVYIGMNASDATISAIRATTAAGTRLQHVRLFRARMNAGRTAMSFVPL